MTRRRALAPLIVLALATSNAACQGGASGSGDRLVSAQVVDGGIANGVSISLRVRDAQKENFEGAEVFLFCAAHPAGSTSCGGVAGPYYTDRQGLLSLRRLPAGQYKLTIRAGEETQEWETLMTPGATAGRTFDFLSLGGAR